MALDGELALARDWLEQDLMWSIMPDKDDKHYGDDDLAWIGSRMDPTIKKDHTGAWLWLATNMFHDINDTPGLDILDGRDQDDMIERMIMQARHNWYGNDSHQGVLINPGKVSINRTKCDDLNPFDYDYP